MIFRLLLIVCFLRLLMNAKANVDYYYILSYLIIYISIREFIYYLKNVNIKKNKEGELVEGFDYKEYVESWKETFDDSIIDDVLPFLIVIWSVVNTLWDKYNEMDISTLEPKDMLALKGLKGQMYDNEIMRTFKSA